jgi:hypothetical protein
VLWGPRAVAHAKNRNSFLEPDAFGYLNEPDNIAAFLAAETMKDTLFLADAKRWVLVAMKWEVAYVLAPDFPKRKVAAYDFKNVWPCIRWVTQVSISHCCCACLSILTSFVELCLRSLSHSGDLKNIFMQLPAMAARPVFL